MVVEPVRDDNKIKREEIILSHLTDGKDWWNSKNEGRLIRCKDCVNWIPGYITDDDDFIPPKCGKYQQMVGHDSNDFCSLAVPNEGEKDATERNT